jgi:hypothetical protein
MKIRRRPADQNHPRPGPTDVVLGGDELAAAVMAYLAARNVVITGSSKVVILHRGQTYGVGCFDAIVVVDPAGEVREPGASR